MVHISNLSYGYTSILSLKTESERKFFSSSKTYHIRFSLHRKFYFIIISLFMHIFFLLSPLWVFNFASPLFFLSPRLFFSFDENLSPRLLISFYTFFFFFFPLNLVCFFPQSFLSLSSSISTIQPSNAIFSLPIKCLPITPSPFKHPISVFPIHITADSLYFGLFGFFSLFFFFFLNNSARLSQLLPFGFFLKLN